MNIKKSVIVLFGGISSEHEVSCCSAASILRNIDRSNWDVHSVGITKDGKWLLTNASTDSIENGNWIFEVDNKDVTVSVNRSFKGLYVFETGEIVPVDCIFPVLHGLYGEDGTIQGLCEVAGISYVGCNVPASACSMDKILTKRIVSGTDIKQADFLSFTKGNLESQKEEIKSYFDGRYPLFVKPAKEGSSVGVSKVTDEGDIEAALETAYLYDDNILVEEGIIGREIEVAILGNEYTNLIASNIGEIIVENGFYSYSSKYGDDESGVVSAQTRIIDDLEADLVCRIQDCAKIVYSALGCQGLARVDFFLTKDNQVVFNEINTMPGFTKISMYPKLMNSVGIDYTKLIDMLIHSAINKE